MEAAYEWMEAMAKYSVCECGEPIVSLRDVASEAKVEVEFSTTKIVNDLDRIFALRAGLINDFLGIAREMNQRGWVLKVEDGYRTVAMQKQLGRMPSLFDAILKRSIWECQGEVPTADFILRRVTGLCATSAKVGTHISASAMDISVLSRDDGTEIDRGGPYIEISELTPMDSPFIAPEAAANRRAIQEIMETHGFMAYPYEFWHFSKGDSYAETLLNSRQPARYGPVHVDFKNGSVFPVENPLEPLHSITEIRQEIEAALKRLSQPGRATFSNC